MNAIAASRSTAISDFGESQLLVSWVVVGNEET